MYQDVKQPSGQVAYVQGWIAKDGIPINDKELAEFFTLEEIDLSSFTYGDCTLIEFKLEKVNPCDLKK